MEINQEVILKYLIRDFLATSKQSDEEELYMFDYLIENELMSLTPQGSAHINNYGKSFISNSNYFNPVPLSTLDWKMNIIEQLKDGKAILKGYGKLQEQAYDELKQDGIVEQVGTTYEKTLTTKGRQYLTSGLTYNDFLNTNRHNVTINTGHNINAPVTQSDLSNRSNTQDKTTFTSTTTPQQSNRKSPTRIVIEIILLLAAIAAIIEVLHIYHVTIHF